MNTNLIDNYKTSHVPLAAYLKMKGNTMNNVVIEGRRGIFTFAFVHREHIIEFNNGQAMVEPNEFADKMSQLTQTAKRILADHGDK
jgi:hypothetical protein